MTNWGFIDSVGFVLSPGCWHCYEGILASNHHALATAPFHETIHIPCREYPLHAIGHRSAIGHCWQMSNTETAAVVV